MIIHQGEIFHRATSLPEVCPILSCCNSLLTGTYKKASFFSGFYLLFIKHVNLDNENNNNNNNKNNNKNNNNNNFDIILNIKL